MGKKIPIREHHYRAAVISCPHCERELVLQANEEQGCPCGKLRAVYHQGFGTARELQWVRPDLRADKPSPRLGT